MTSYNDIPSLISRIKELERRMSETESAPRAGLTAISDGGGINLYDPITGTLVGRYGQQFDGTYTASSLGGPIPPPPSTPLVFEMPGGVDIAWDGVFDEDALVPMDFARVEIHLGGTESFIPASGTLVGTFESPQGGRQFFPIESLSTVYVKFITRTQSGKMSTPSLPASGQPQPIAADTPIPDVPGITLLSGQWGYRTDYTAGANFILEWSEVTEDTDGNPINVTAYEVWYRIASLPWQFAVSVSQPNAFIHGYELDIPYEFKVRALSAQAASDFSVAESGQVLSSTVSEDFDWPDVSASSQLSTIVVNYTGRDAVSLDVPGPFVDRVEISIRADIADPEEVAISFTPYAPYSTPVPVSNLEIGEDFYVSARYVTKSGTEGPWTSVDGSPVTILGVVDEDLVSSSVVADIADANTNATAALTAANGKSVVTYATTDPVGDGVQAGDTWYRRDGSNNIINQWRWSGSAWIVTVPTNATVTSLDAGAITSGFINTARLQANSIGVEKLVVGATTPSNIITVNPGFESSGTGWVFPVPGNNYTTTGFARTGTQSAVSVYVGGVAGRTTLVQRANTHLIEVTGDTVYTVGVWVKRAASSSSGATTTLELLVGTSSTAGTYPSSYTTVVSELASAFPASSSVNDYRYFSGTFKTPTSASPLYMGFKLDAVDIMSSFSLDYDDFVITPQFSGVVIGDGQVTAPKIAANAITSGKINAGAIDGMIITGAILRTASSGQRVHIDTTGLKGYNNLSQVMTEISASTGKFSATDGTFSGAITATSGAISGDLTVSGTLSGTYYSLSSVGFEYKIGATTVLKITGQKSSFDYLPGYFATRGISLASDVDAPAGTNQSIGSLTYDGLTYQRLKQTMTSTLPAGNQSVTKLSTTPLTWNYAYDFGVQSLGLEVGRYVSNTTDPSILGAAVKVTQVTPDGIQMKASANDYGPSAINAERGLTIRASDITILSQAIGDYGNSGNAPMTIRGLMTQYDVAYFSGWGAYPGTTFNNLRCTRIGSVVILNGIISRTGSTVAAGVATHNLADVTAAGGVPDKQQIWLGRGYSGSAFVDVRVDVLTSGAVTAAWQSSAPWTQNTSWIFINMVYNANY